MIIVRATLRGITAYEPGRYYQPNKKDGESDDAHDERTWRERAHCTPDGDVYIDGMCFKRALETASKTLGIKIKGKGKQNYTKYFVRAVIPTGNVMLGIRKKDLDKVDLFLPANAKDGPRVTRRFPCIEQWTGVLELAVLDPILPESVVRKCLNYAGDFVGVGTFRPERGGMCGRFNVESFEWIVAEEEEAA